MDKVANKTNLYHDRRTLFRNQDKPDTAGQEDKENNHLENTADTRQVEKYDTALIPVATCCSTGRYTHTNTNQSEPKLSVSDRLLQDEGCVRYNQHIMESSANITSSEEAIYCRQEHENIFLGSFFILLSMG